VRAARATSFCTRLARHFSASIRGFRLAPPMTMMFTFFARNQHAVGGERTEKGRRLSGGDTEVSSSERPLESAWRADVSRSLLLLYWYKYAFQFSKETNQSLPSSSSWSKSSKAAYCISLASARKKRCWGAFASLPKTAAGGGPFFASITMNSTNDSAAGCRYPTTDLLLLLLLLRQHTLHAGISTRPMTSCRGNIVTMMDHGRQ